MKASHNLDRLGVTFDEPGLVADAGLLLTATLAQRLGLRAALDCHLKLGRVAGAANAGQKAMTLIASILAGGDTIDDANALRAGNAATVLGHRPAAPSTLGTFLRAFTAGHARQLDAVLEDVLSRAWDLGARPTGATTKIDLDSSIVETYGLHKQGGSNFTYTHTRGYHPLFAVLAGGGDVIHCRLRGGSANSGRGAGSFTRQTLVRLARAGTSGDVVVRADSGFYSRHVVDACERHGAYFSVSVRLQASHHKLIEEIAESAWEEIPYWLEGTAAVAEIPYAPFGRRCAYRLIVRRVEPTPGSQLALRGLAYRYFAFITDREGATVELEADHRQHAEIENVIRELKYGCGLNHMPSGKFGANAAWLVLNAIAHNLARWLLRLTDAGVANLKSLRHRLLKVPGRLVRSSRRLRLRMPERWPWEAEFMAALARLRLLPAG